MATSKAATKVKVGPETTAIARAKAQLPANAVDLMREQAAALAARLAAPAGKGINVSQDKLFSFPGTDEKFSSFKGIIIGFIARNAWYEGAYNPNNIVPPNCFAIGTITGSAKNDDLIASSSSPDPQNADNDNECKSCWANQWKSGQGNGKACKNQRVLAVLCDDGELRTLTLSSTALKHFDNYVRDIAKAFSMPPFVVMTEFVFADDETFPSIRCVNPLKLNDDQIALAYSLQSDAESLLSQEPDTSTFEEKVVAARNKPKGGKGAPATKSARR